MTNTLTPLLRMLWKESRAWRTLFLGCVIGCIALQAFIVLVVQWSNPSTGGWTWPLLGFAMWVPGIYILACLAAMFAGEREERTADWLLALSPPPGAVIAAKLLFAAASGLVMQAVLLLVVVGFSRFDRDYEISAVHQFVREDLALTALFIIFETLAWGLFCSLWTSHPLRAIVAGAVAIVAVNIFWAVAEADGVQLGLIPTKAWADAIAMGGWLRTLWTLAVLVIGIVLARRWLLGRYDLVPGVRLPQTWPQWFLVRHSTREAATGWQRAWQRVWWLELTGLRGYWLLALLLTLAAMVTFFFGSNPTPAFAFFLGALLPLLAGLDAWQREHTREHFRFYADRGISPMGLWLNKLALWLFGSVVAVAALAVLSFGAWELFSSINSEHWRPLFPPAVQAGRMPRGWFYEPVAIGALFVVTATVIGFLTSQLFRRRVIAFGLGAMGCIALGMTLAISYAMGLPLWLFGLAIPVWLIWLSARQVPRIWREEPRWSDRLKLGAEILVPPLVWFAAMAAYRVYEVPKVELPTARSVAHQAATTQQFPTMPQLWGQIVQQVSQLTFPPYPEPVPLGEAAFGDAAAGPALAGGMFGTGDGMEAGEPDWTAGLQENADGMAALLRSLREAHLMTPDAAIWSRASIPHVQLALDLFGRAAERDLAQGNSDASALWLQSAMRLAGSTTCYAPLEQRQRIAQQLDNLAQTTLVRWAQHPSQTEESLTQSLSLCAREVRFWTVWEDDLVAEYNWGIKAVEQRHDFDVYRWYPWEFWRKYRMEGCSNQNRITYLQHARQGIFRAGWGPVPNFPSPGQADSAWTFRDREEQRRSGDHPLGITAPTILNLFDRETRYHGLMVAAAVAGFERVHGQLPARLDEVVHFFGQTPEIVRDPWSGEDLQYQPAGFLPGTQGVPTGIAANTPLIWSVGPEQVQLVRTGDTQTLLARTRMSDRWQTFRSSYTLESQLRYAFPVPRLKKIDYVQREDASSLVETALRDD